MTLTYQAASSAASPSRPPLYTEFVGPQADARVELRCGLPRPLCSRLRPDVRDRQTDVRRASLLNAPTLWAGA